jgi:Helix-turn-helix domain
VTSPRCWASVNQFAQPRTSFLVAEGFTGPRSSSPMAASQMLSRSQVVGRSRSRSARDPVLEILGDSTMSTAELAARLSRSEQVVRRNLKELVEDGLVTVNGGSGLADDVPPIEVVKTQTLNRYGTTACASLAGLAVVAGEAGGADAALGEVGEEGGGVDVLVA